MLSEGEQIIAKVTTILDRLGISYLIGGSVASGIHGVYRYTNDIDIVADIPVEKIHLLAAALGDFYADSDTMIDAIQSRTSFSIIHLELMIKVDIFLKANEDWTDEVWRRRTLTPISTDGTLRAYLPSPEDAILQKIRWFQLGGGASDRQWSDVLGMLKMRSGTLDYDYMKEWAAHLNLSQLLDTAMGMA